MVQVSLLATGAVATYGSSKKALIYWSHGERRLTGTLRMLSLSSSISSSAIGVHGLSRIANWANQASVASRHAAV